MHLLKGKKALVTGATAGIGQEIALQYALQGASVAIWGTNEERAASTLAELEKNRVFPEQSFSSALCDVADKKQVDSTLNALLESFGNLDILVNNAGITRDGLLMKMSEEDWDRVLATNLKSVYNTCQALVRPMLKAKQGKIINISSIVGLTGNAGQVNYASSKAGMIGFTKSLAQEVGSRGICVNCIAPGFIQTKMTDILKEEVKQELLKKIPMKRLGVPQDIASVAVFLGSSLSDYMTGQVLVVDGGMVM